MTGPHPPPLPHLPGTPGLEQPQTHSRALSQQACDLEMGAAGGGPHGKPLSSQHLPQPPSTDVSSSPQNLSSCHASQAKLLDAASSEHSTLAPRHEAGGLAAGSGGGPSAAMSTIGSSGPLVGCRWLLQRCSSMCPPCPGQAYGGNAAAGAGASIRSGSASVAPLFSVQSQLPSAPPLVRSRVEPKTFFAAERTFLAWMNIAVLVRTYGRHHGQLQGRRGSVRKSSAFQVFRRAQTFASHINLGRPAGTPYSLQALALLMCLSHAPTLHAGHVCVSQPHL